MSRNVNKCIDRIFDRLRHAIAEEDESRVASINRHIKASGDELTAIDFVKSASVLKLPVDPCIGGIYLFREKLYLLVKDIYSEAVQELDLVKLNNSDYDTVSSESIQIIQGCEMLAIYEGIISVKQSYSSIQIVDECLGQVENNTEDIVFSFDSIKTFFEECAVFAIELNRFELQYFEDLYRLCGHLISYRKSSLSIDTYSKIRELLLLRSSRSISASVISGLQSSLKEYSFLQLYQCLEYMFRLNNALAIVKSHGVAQEAAIKIVQEYEFRLTESENLKRVIENHATGTAVDEFIVYLNNFDPTVSQKSHQEKCTKVSEYIYKIRCNIAHLRYKQDTSLMPKDWDCAIEKLAKLVFEVYSNRDKDIIQICELNSAWKVLEFGCCQ